MKKVMSIILIIMISFMLMTGCGKINKKDENSIPEDNKIKEEINDDGTLKEEKNENSEVVKEQIVNGITLSNTNLTSTAYSSKITIEATNNTDEDIIIDYFKVILKDKDGNNVLGDGGFAVAPVSGKIKSKTTKTLYVDFDSDLSNVMSITYEVIK